MSDTPNNAALLAELSALTAEVRAIRAEQAALTARSSAFTAIQTGEAVYPAAGDTVELAEPWEPVARRTPIGVDALGFPVYAFAVSCKAEGDEIVVRIPNGPTRVLVAVEGPADMWVSGWLIQSGSTDESPRALLNRLSGSGVSPAPSSEGPRQSQACAQSPETPTSVRPGETAPCRLSSGAQGPANCSAGAKRSAC